ncbi:VWA-like domain-containing protein [Ferrimonas sp. YFM]|uniref:vWA domain-containing protein n=1 Tax=Ferrimonas sp. YFM TaxID=3028878 RepID=UPI0025728CC7|nr:VWA-like domain-containing protein [Ferrimonas sp. YFM]BDY05204.1 hypothetical protein F0521_22450 [Ferrimonas sp. YFM]
MLKEPFYGHYLSSFHKASHEQGDTDSPPLEIKLKDNSNIQFVCQLQSWNALNEDQQLGALKHEALHLVLGHPFGRHSYADSARFDLAADLVVNQYIEPHQLTDNAPTLERVNAWLSRQGQPGLEPHRELAYYYGQLPASAQMPGANVDGAGAGHQNWNALGQLQQASRALLEQQLDSKLEQSAQRTEQVNARARGLLPANVLEALEQAIARRRPTVNWRRLLRLFASSARRTSVKNTLRRPSKRYGTTPGTRIQPHQHILVAVDTSASVDDGQLQLFFEELHHIWRAGAQLTVVECDTQIQRQYLYRGEPPAEVQGRGGTCFDQPIECANRLRVDAIVYFTDGEAPPPEVPARAPLLWLIHSDRVAPINTPLRHCGRVIPMAPAEHR